MTSAAFEAPRRQLSGRRPEMVMRLLDAAVTEIAATGYDGLTVRNVAKAAGVSAATAYSHFASKEHLLTEVFWRRLSNLPAVEYQPGWTVAQRVEATVGPMAMLVADEPELAGGVTTALLAHDPDVKVLRGLVGEIIAARLAAALGDKASSTAHLGLTMAFTGALLSAGMGMLDNRQLAGLLGDFAGLIGDAS